MESYEKLNKKFAKKKPNKKRIKSFKLELFRQSETKKMYKCNSCTLEENFGTLKEYYPLTNNEILSILDYYDVFSHLDIVILHYKLENIQEFVSQEVKDRKLLTLKIPSKLAIELRMHGLRENALFTLLHECSHLLGNVKDPTVTCEKEADRFGMQEFKKWKHAIDLKDNDF